MKDLEIIVPEKLDVEAVFIKGNAERKERMRPDKEKLLAFAKFLVDGIEYPEVDAIEAEKALGAVEIGISEIAEQLEREAKRL